VRFEFGVFDNLDLGGATAGQVMTERLEFVVEAERLGFDHYHLAEHHATPLSVCPSPNLFLSARTQRTRRIRIGALVYVLPRVRPVPPGRGDRRTRPVERRPPMQPVDSTSSTLAPRRAAQIAAVAPAGPPPATTRS